MWLIIALSLVVLAFYFLGVKPYNYWMDKGLPHVKPVPFFGNIASVVLQMKPFSDILQESYNAHRKQRYFGTYQFMQPVLMVKDPELIRKITIKDFDVFSEHRSFVTDDVDPLWGRNLLSLKGEKWHNMRATLSPTFTSSKMRMMYTLMKNCTKQYVEYYKKQGGLVTIEMKDSFTRFTNDVIASTAFGIDCDSLVNPNNEFYLMGKDATNFTGIRALRFFLSTISPAIMKMFNIGIFNKEVSTFFRNLIKETLSVREKLGIVRPDMVHLLMETKKGYSKPDDIHEKIPDSGFAVVQEWDSVKSGLKPIKSEITNDDITAQALIFFLAGFDTASTFMCFTAYELALNPEVQDKLQNEIDEAYENSNNDISYETLLGLKYLDMVVSESLRKWPPSIVLDRQSVKNYTIEPQVGNCGGEKPFTIEKGTNIWVPTLSIHRDPSYYPDPEKFDPERFNDDNKQNIKPFTYLPFGLGPRNCIGSRFALLEGKLIIAELIRNFEIVPVDKTQIPLKLRKGAFVPLAENGFWLGLKPRRHLDRD